MALDRSAGNLDVLAEEEDEESWDDSESDDGQDGGIRKSEPNKFDNLCDGVHNSVAMVHAGVQEYLELKDELLKHSLPPNVLITLGTVSGKLFRSISDLNHPLNELIRLVRVYSTPWEEKSAALKKLHEDYESKQRQLNIAIKRLQLIDAHSKKVAKDRRIMNWEKLFSKLTTARGHGRRWKFRIEEFKSKAKLGLEHVEAMLGELNSDSSESEDDDLELAEQLRIKLGSRGSDMASSDRMGSGMDSEGDDDESGDDGGDEDDEGDSDSASDIKMVRFTDDFILDGVDTFGRPSTRASSISDKNMRLVPAELKPEMSDCATWTHEPETTISLRVRVYTPVDIDSRELKCHLVYKDNYYKTSQLDMALPTDSDVESNASKEKEEAEKDKKKERPKGGRLIGSKTNARPAAAGAGRVGSRVTSANNMNKYEEFEFSMAPPPKTKSKRPATVVEDNLRISVHTGPMEEMHSMATVEMKDLELLDLPIIVEPLETGDEDILDGRDTPLSQLDWEEQLKRSDAKKKTLERESVSSSRPSTRGDDPASKLRKAVPVNFPLYSIQHRGRTDSVQMPVGAVPLVCYWSKRVQPLTLTRAGETNPLKELVNDLTGIDLDKWDKKSLHKDLKERGLSPISFTPEPIEETVPQSEYDALKQQHVDEMVMLQEEYERRLQELAENMHNMVRTEGGEDMSHSQSQMAPSRPYSGEYSTTSMPKPPNKEKSDASRSKKSFRIGKNNPKWGEKLQKGFFERMKTYEEESMHNRDRVKEEVMGEVREQIEKQMAGQFRLSSKQGEDMYDVMQDVNLPAVFMPFQSGNVFNPRAHQYFHATGAGDMRLTQPPSMLQLPPIPKNKLSVMNLFDLSQNFHRDGPEYSIKKWLESGDGMPNSAPHTRVHSRYESPLNKAYSQNNPNRNTIPDYQNRNVIPDYQNRNPIPDYQNRNTVPDYQNVPESLNEQEVPSS